MSYKGGSTMIDINVCFFGCGKVRNGIDDPEFNGEDDYVCRACRIANPGTNAGSVVHLLRKENK
jgi:hypothetical protein